MNNSHLAAIVAADDVSNGLLKGSGDCLLLFGSISTLATAAKVEGLTGAAASLANLDPIKGKAEIAFVNAAQSTKPLWDRYAKASDFPVHTHQNIAAKSAHELMVRVAAACLAAWQGTDSPSVGNALASFGAALSRLRPLIERETKLAQDRRAMELLLPEQDGHDTPAVNVNEVTPPAKSREERLDDVELHLSGQLLHLFKRLRKTRHPVWFETLREVEDAWRKRDPPDGTIRVAIERLNEKLSDTGWTVSQSGTTESPKAKLVDLSQDTM